MRIGIICNLGGGKIGGQTAKTQQITDYLAEHAPTEVYDLYPAKAARNYIKIILESVKVCRNTDVTVIILNIRGTHLVLTGLKLFGLHKIRPIYDIAVGGKRHSYARKSRHFRKVEKITTKLFVETSHMAKEFCSMGITQAEVLPNCKYMTFDRKPDFHPYNIPLKLCTFSRVIEDKGIDTAIETANLLNSSGIDTKLDIYGPVDPSYKESFDRLLAGNEDNHIKYQGPVDPSEACSVLFGHHMLIMPTRHDEGFPGAFLDAMEASLLILAPRLENFRDIIIDGENGFLLDDNTAAAYASKIRDILDNEGLLLNMRKKSREMSRNYSSEKVLGRLLALLQAEPAIKDLK